MPDLDRLYSIRRMGRNDDPAEPWNWPWIGSTRAFPTFLAAVRQHSESAELLRTVPILDGRGETVATGAIFVDHAGRHFSIRRVD